jgi:microcystin-dependent protein
MCQCQPDIGGGGINDLYRRLSALAAIVEANRGYIDVLLDQVEDLFTLMPQVGDIILFGGPEGGKSGWLECYGQSLSVDDFPELFAVIGYTFGGSSEEFRLPRLYDHFLLGTGPFPGPNVEGLTGGENSVTLGEAEMPRHRHLLRSSISGAVGIANSNTGAMKGTLGEIIGRRTGTTEIELPDAIMLTGSGAAHENRPQFLRLHYLIKALP